MSDTRKDPETWRRLAEEEGLIFRPDPVRDDVVDEILSRDLGVDPKTPMVNHLDTRLVRGGLREAYERGQLAVQSDASRSEKYFTPAVLAEYNRLREAYAGVDALDAFAALNAQADQADALQAAYDAAGASATASAASSNQAAEALLELGLEGMQGLRGNARDLRERVWSAAFANLLGRYSGERAWELADVCAAAYAAEKVRREGPGSAASDPGGVTLAANEETSLLEFLALAATIEKADTIDDINGWLEDAESGDLGVALQRLVRTMAAEVTVLVTRDDPVVRQGEEA